MFIWIFVSFNSQCWMTFKEVSMITWKRNDSSSQGSISRHSYFIAVESSPRLEDIFITMRNN